MRRRGLNSRPSSGHGAKLVAEANTRFLQRLKNAVVDFYTHRDSNGFEPAEYQPAYKTKALSVFRIPRIAEIRHGFHFKDTDEFGLYSVFYADGRDRPYESYYRSDRMFEVESHLDYLRIAARRGETPVYFGRLRLLQMPIVLVTLGIAVAIVLGQS